jgi:hypothetical protein
LPPQAFGRDADVAHVRMSPDGKLLAWAEGALLAPYVSVYDVATSRVVNHFRVSAPLKLQSLIWADNFTLLLQVHFTDQANVRFNRAYEIFRVLAFSVPTGKTTMC